MHCLLGYYCLKTFTAKKSIEHLGIRGELLIYALSLGYG